VCGENDMCILRVFFKICLTFSHVFTFMLALVSAQLYVFLLSFSLFLSHFHTRSLFLANASLSAPPARLSPAATLPQVKQIDDDEARPVRVAPVAASPPFHGDPGPAEVPHASDVVFGMSTMERFQVHTQKQMRFES
jgi:hypothetical protein